MSQGKQKIAKMFQESVFPPQHRTKCYCHAKRETKTYDSGLNIPSLAQNDGHSFVKVNKPRLRFAGKKSNFVHVKSVPCEAYASHDQLYTNRRFEYETSGRVASDIKTSIGDGLKSNSPIHPKNVDHFQRLEALSAYRFDNRDECISDSHNSLRHSNRTAAAAVPAHTCQYRLKLNERNRPIPVLDAKKDGSMMCSVCRKFSPKNMYGGSDQLLATENCVILRKSHSTDSTLNRLGQNATTLLILELPDQPVANVNGNVKKSASNRFGIGGNKNRMKMYRGTLSLKCQANVFK